VNSPHPPSRDPFPTAPPAPPAKKKHRWPWVLLVAALVACPFFGAMAMLVSLVDGPVDTTTTVAAAAGETATEAPAVGVALTAPAPLGTAVTPAKGVTVKVVAADLNANAVMATDPYTGRPAAGMQWVTVTLEATNSTGTPSSIGQHLKLQLIGTDGVAVEQSYYPVPYGELKVSAQLQPGTTITGKLAYQVPVTQLAAVVLLAEPQFTLDENTDQRFLAIR
jgi:hypothetical protein